MRFIETFDGRLIPLSRLVQAAAKYPSPGFAYYQLLLDDGEEVRASVPDWNAATRLGPSIIPAAPGTTVLIEKSEWIEGEDEFYELPCVGWKQATGRLLPVCMTHGSVSTLLTGVKHPCGRVETLEGELYSDLDAFRAAQRAELLPDAGNAQGDPAYPASVSA